MRELRIDLLKVILDGSFDWEYFVSPAGECLYCSPSCERITGYPPSRFLESPGFLETIIVPEDQALLRAHTLRLGQDEDIDFRIRSASGELRWISHACSVLRDDSGAILGRRSTNRDVTGRKEIEERYRLLNDRTSIALDASGIGIWDWDLVSGELAWDARMYELYGLDSREDRPSFDSWKSIVHPEDLARSLDELESTLRGEREYDVLFRIALPSGEERWLRSVARLFRDDSGKPLRMTGINVDVTEARRAESRIRRQNELLAKTGAMAKVGYWEFDPSTGRGDWSEEVSRIHDLDPSVAATEELGLSFYSGESRTRIEEAVKAAVYERKPYDLALELVSAKGRRKWVRTIGEPVVEDDKVVMVEGIFQDITELKDAEAELRSREATLRLFVENSPAAIAMFDREMCYIVASRRWLEDYGLGEVDLAGRCHYDVFPEIGEDWKAVHRRCLAGAVERREDDHFLRADGGTDWVRWEVRPWNEASGEIGGIIIFSEVVTERKRAELALSSSEERYRSLFENMIEGLAYCHMHYEDGLPVDWTYIAVNPSFERLTSLRGAAGRRVSQLIPGIRDSDPRLFEIYGRVASSGSPESFEIEVSSLGMWFSVSVYSPSPGYFVAVFDVITERKRAEEQVRRLNEELEERVAARTAELEAANSDLRSFSYSVSHDLRSPLRAISGYAGMLEERSSTLDEEGRRQLANIRAATTRMERLIGDLLKFSRIGRAELERASVDMDSLVRSVIDEILPPGAERRVEIVLGPLGRVSGDVALLRQVWVNLISNAVKFSSKSEAPRIEVSCSEAEGASRFSVRDNGAGFDMRYRDKLFNVFQRLHSARDFEGTGVGLAIVQRIVERHGGSVDAEGRIGEGAEVSFTLPPSA
jgi:PAS domain S-box